MSSMQQQQQQQSQSQSQSSLHPQSQLQFQQQPQHRMTSSTRLSSTSTSSSSSTTTSTSVPRDDPPNHEDVKRMRMMNGPPDNHHDDKEDTEDAAVIAAPPPEATHEDDDAMSRRVAEIPPEECKPSAKDSEEEEEEDDESDWGENHTNHHNEEDEDDDEDDDASEYEYEDDDDMGFSGFLVSAPTAPARIEQDPKPAPSKWKDPTPEAVGMSLRAQSEPSGGKRRLAQDLFKIMNQDTEEAGFSLAPKSEDSMDVWTIKLFQFDEESNLCKDMHVLKIDHIELEMKFPDQYPFEPPFVRVVRPRFKRQTGFVMNGALCMELLTKEGWNPINDIESVIVSIRSLLVVGDGRLAAASELSTELYDSLLETGKAEDSKEPAAKKNKKGEKGTSSSDPKTASSTTAAVRREHVGSYTASEAQSAYAHLSDYHKKKGWDNSGWWARKG